MSNAPYFYDYQNANQSMVSPSSIKPSNNAVSLMYQRYLLQKAISVFKWVIPESWNRDYFLYVLYTWGFIAVFDSEQFGVIPQQCGLQGYNIFYQPTKVLVTNQLLKPMTQTLEIGEQCEVLKLMPNYGSIMDIVSYYADQLALAAESRDMNLINSKLAYVFFAKNNTQAQAFKRLYDDIAAGNPSAVIDKSLLDDQGKPQWAMFDRGLKESYLVTDILSDMRKIEAMFDTEIGIPNANTDKRERLVTDEVNANNVETYTKAALWLEELKKACERVNNHFGLSLSVDWRNPPESAESEVLPLES